MNLASLAILLISARQTIGTDCPEGKMMVKNVCVCSSSSKLDECKGRGNLDHIRALNRGKCNDRGWHENDACKCDEGWSGVDCWTVECENNGKQKDRFNICECPKGFRGARCEKKDCGKFWEGNDCRVPICQNNGTRVPPSSSSEYPTCECPTWFRGSACQYAKCKHGNLTNNKH